jgi:hypothetical protein
MYKIMDIEFCRKVHNVDRSLPCHVNHACKERKNNNEIVCCYICWKKKNHPKECWNALVPDDDIYFRFLMLYKENKND